MDFYKKTADEVLTNLRSSRQGLSEEEVAARKRDYGINKLATPPGKSLLRRFGEQMADPMTILSLVATTVVCEVPLLASAFDFTAVDLREYLVAIALGFMVIPCVEVVKFFQRRKERV